MKARTGIFVLAVALLPGAAVAQVRLNNPGFPSSEVLEYTETIGKALHPWSSSLRLVREGEAERYEFRSSGQGLESLYTISPDTLISLASRTITRSDDATVTRTATYEDLRPHAAADELVVTDLGSLPIVLRGFPWGTVSSARLLFVGNPGSDAFSFEIRVLGREAISAAGRSWDCWHVTTGVGGAVSLLLSKTDWWFAVEGSHPLIKTSGPSAGPGSPKRTLVLERRTVTAEPASGP